jgi:hypothetical protein
MKAISGNQIQIDFTTTPSLRETPPYQGGELTHEEIQILRL